MARKFRIMKHFPEITDRRREHGKLHKLDDILLICFAASFCGCVGWSEIHEWAVDREIWLRKFLELKNGLPCTDTIANVIKSINPKKLAECFGNWSRTLGMATKGLFRPIDGKTVRGASHKSPLHMVTAWCAENQLILAQIRTADKSNEISAIPLLFELFRVGGSIVTIDAMGCQKKIVRKLAELGGEYVIQLKGNQKKLHDFAKKARSIEFIKNPVKSQSTILTEGEGHGRKERREHVLIDVAEMRERLDPDEWPDLRTWANLKSIGVVISTRTVKGGKTTVEVRFYISSLPWNDVEKFSQAVRSHWSIENNLHWVLDVCMRDDACRVRESWGAENLSTLRRFALQSLEKDETCKKGIAIKMQKANRNEAYLEQLMMLEVA